MHCILDVQLVSLYNDYYTVRILIIIGNYFHMCRVVEICPAPLSLVACYGGCVLVKRCAQRSFAQFGRSTLASDMISELPHVVKELFDS